MSALKLPAYARNWVALEIWLERAFRRERRQNGERLAEHAVNVGRDLLQAGHDAVTVFGGYCHAAAAKLNMSRDEVLDLAIAILHDSAAAEAAAALVVEAGHTSEERALPAEARDAAAAARWRSSTDPRLHEIKAADEATSERRGWVRSAARLAA